MPERDLLDRERLSRVTEDMIVAITSAPFVDAMHTMKATADEDRLKLASKILTPQALRAKGVPLPDDMRITSRYFEANKPAIEVSDDPAHLVPGEIYPDGACGCACGGAATVCGGAGGGGSQIQ